ncbi:MAG: murein hydrolase activator EnvC family protein [Rhizobiaceae bacterium]
MSKTGPALARGIAFAALLSVAVLASSHSGFTQETQVSPKVGEITQKSDELDQLTKEAALSEARIKELDASIETLKKDEATVTAALIQSAKTAKKLTADVSDIEERLAGQREEEDAIHASLKSRRGVLAEVLAGLQRMGLNPPPAILVKPEDALSSVRSAILLGSVVPELRRETELLIADLDSLKRVTASIANERASLLEVLKTQSEERHLLDALIAQKQALRSQSEAQLKAENERYEAIANQATSLKDLIGELEKDLAAEENAAERKRRAEDRRLALEREKAKNADPSEGRLKPGVSLASLKGALTLPVAGKTVRGFGADDGFGGTSAGITIASPPSSVVLTPVDATILYAGPFRSYHQLLILDAGSGYHLVMGGMDKSVVTVGQFVLSGEPVGVMGEKPHSGANVLTDMPELYIEFRQDSKPVDSAPWWASEPKGKTGNDT